MSLTPIDSQFMARALRLAEQGLYSTSPNPRVGCVLVKEGRVVGEDWHRAAGQPHAEVLALQQAGDAARDATCYLSLEPCSHTGRTGPCSEALIQAGVSRLVYAMEDPNPEVAGSGLEQLEKAGIQVDGPLMQSDARALNPGFIRRMATGRPLVRVKMAISLDGRTAMPDGNSYWVTGPKAREDVQRLRARSCAVLSGWRSVEMDKAQMTVRPDEFGLDLGSRQPLRVLLDAQCRLPQDARFFRAESPVLVANLQRDDEQGHIRHVRLPEKQGHIDLHAVLDLLGQMEINELLVESGPELSGAFMRAGLVDELVIYMAPKLMGSNSAPLFGLPLQKMAEALPLHFTEVRQIGGDLRITALLEKE